MPSPSPQDGLPRPSNVNKVVKKSHQMNTRFGKTPSPTIGTNDGSWPTPAEAAAVSAQQSIKRNSPKKSPKKSPMNNKNTSPVLFTPSKSRMAQEPRSIVSEERIRQKRATEMARFEEAKRFMDEINGSYPSLSNLEQEDFLNEIRNTGILVVLVDNIMKRMQVTVDCASKVDTENVMSPSPNSHARHNAVYFMAACEALNVSVDIRLSCTDILHGKLLPIVNNILAISDIYNNRNKKLDNFNESKMEGVGVVLNPLWGAAQEDEEGAEEIVEDEDKVTTEINEQVDEKQIQTDNEAPNNIDESSLVEKKEEKLSECVGKQEEKEEVIQEDIEEEVEKSELTTKENYNAIEEVRAMEQNSLLRKKMLAQQAQDYEEKKQKMEQDMIEKKKKITMQAENTLKCFTSVSVSSFKNDVAQELKSCADDVGTIMSKLCRATKAHQKLAKDTEETLRKETAERKRLFNELQVIKGNIRVFVRLRPGKEDAVKATQLTKEGDLMVDLEANMTEEQKAKAMATGRTTAPKIYEFDHVFGPQSSQAEVFKEVSPLVTSVMDGWHSSILAYGQTGSGKTFTMEGVPGNEGVNFRALRELFRIAEEKVASGIETVEVKVTMVEIYNEQTKDLLSEDGGESAKCDIKLRPAAEGGGVYLPNATTITVNSIEDVNKAMERGKANRSTGSTKANEHSSRSHSILMIDVKVTNIATGLCSEGRLSLVDLAGSERIAKTGATGNTLKEAQAINKSLSALGNVISSLKAKQGGENKASSGGHVPYRDSKLTYLLQDSLGADNKTLVVVQVSPDAIDVQETNCSVTFGARARNVELGSMSTSAGSKNGNAKMNATKQLQTETLLAKSNKEKTVLEAKVADMEKKMKAYEKQIEEMKQKEKSVSSALKASNIENAALIEKEKKAALKAQVQASKKKEPSMTSKQLEKYDQIEIENANLRKQLFDMKKKKEAESSKVAKLEKEAAKKSLKSSSAIATDKKLTSSFKGTSESNLCPKIVEESQEIGKDEVEEPERKDQVEVEVEPVPVTFAEVVASPPKMKDEMSQNSNENISPKNQTSKVNRKVSFISPVRSPLTTTQGASTNIVNLNNDMKEIDKNESVDCHKSFRKTPCKEKPSLQAATTSSMRSSMLSSKSGATRVSVTDTKVKSVNKGALRIAQSSTGAASRRSSVASSSRWH